MAEAVLTLSQTPNRTNHDHTADDFAVGQRVKAHPATDTFMRGDVYGTIDHISRGQSGWCWSRWIAVAGVLGLRRAIFFMLMSRAHQTASLQLCVLHLQALTSTNAQGG